MGATRHRWGKKRAKLLTRHNLLALFAAGIVGLKHRTMAWFGVLWFFLHLLPTNSFTPASTWRTADSFVLPPGALPRTRRGNPRGGRGRIPPAASRPRPLPRQARWLSISGNVFPKM